MFKSEGKEGRESEVYEMRGAKPESDVLTPGLPGGHARARGPSGPRRQGEGTEEEEQEVVALETLPGGAVQVRVTLLAAGFVIGASGSSVREIMNTTGATIQSWTQQAHADGYRRPTRVFRISGTRRAVHSAAEIISDAVERYKELCEGKRRGEFVQRQQHVRGVEFAYQPPPRSAAPQAAALGNSSSPASYVEASTTAPGPSPSSSPASSTIATAVPPARSSIESANTSLPQPAAQSLTSSSPQSFGSSSPSGSPASMTLAAPTSTGMVHAASNNTKNSNSSANTGYTANHSGKMQVQQAQQWGGLRPGSSGGSSSSSMNIPPAKSASTGSWLPQYISSLQGQQIPHPEHPPSQQHPSMFNTNFPPPQRAPDSAKTASRAHQRTEKDPAQNVMPANQQPSPSEAIPYMHDIFGQPQHEGAAPTFLKASSFQDDESHSDPAVKQSASSAPPAGSDYIANLGAWLQQMSMQQQQGGVDTNISATKNDLEASSAMAVPADPLSSLAGSGEFLDDSRPQRAAASNGLRVGGMSAAGGLSSLFQSSGTLAPPPADEWSNSSYMEPENAAFSGAGDFDGLVQQAASSAPTGPSWLQQPNSMRQQQQ